MMRSDPRARPSWTRCAVALAGIACGGPSPEPAHGAALGPPEPAHGAAVGPSEPAHGAAPAPTPIDVGPAPAHAEPPATRPDSDAGVHVRGAPLAAPRMFRRISGGPMRARAIRETWSVATYAGSEVVLQLVVDESSESLQMDGRERNASVWHQVGGATWTTREPAVTPVVLQLEEEHGSTGISLHHYRPVPPPLGKVPPPMAASPKAPPTLTMTCVKATAAIVVGKPPVGRACDGKRPVSTPARRNVEVERCTFAEVSTRPSERDSEGELSFARAPAIEFAYDDSGCSGQIGYYRELLRP